MTQDLYLKAATEAAMNAALLTAGLVYEHTETPIIGYNYKGVYYQNQGSIFETFEGDGGNEDGSYLDDLLTMEKVYGSVVSLWPASGVLIDTIGPITKWDYSVEPPVEKHYPEWHVNVRCGELTEEQLAAVEPFVIIPPDVPYRVWA